MKPTPHFHFADEPAYRAPEPRHSIAWRLRAYRANSKRFNVQRVRAGLYHVRTLHSSAVAVIETR